MSFYKDFRFWIFAMQGVVILVNIGVFVILKFNDLRHLNMYFNEFKKHQREDIQKLFGKIDSLSKQVSGLSGTCEERGIRIKNLENK